MISKEKNSLNAQNFEELANLLQSKPNKGFDFSKNIVQQKNESSLFSSFKDYNINNNGLKNINKAPNLTQIINNQKNEFNNQIGKQKPSIEISKVELLGKKREIDKKEKKNPKKIKKDYYEKDDFYLTALGMTKESMEKAYEEQTKKEQEKKSMTINEILQRNLMGNKVREFITQKEEEKERLAKEKEIKKNYLPIDLSIPIPHINSVRKNNLDKYRHFRPTLNDIYKNVLSFDFYTNERQTEDIPNTFENEAHYRYVWIINFFNELKYCLLNEKIEKSEIQNYENADIKLNLLRLNDIDSKLTLLRMNTSKKLYELKKRILKDNDIIAIFMEKTKLEKSQITLKNEYGLNYFLGIVRREHDSNDLNLLVLREDYENTENSVFTKLEDYIFYDKQIKYLGSINSPLREYKALLDLKLSNFIGIIKTDTIFLNHSIDDINSKPNFNPSNFYLSEKETFLKNLFNSKIFNEPQKNAIYKADSMKNNDILLIQGPPGTGKTHTILGLISLLLKNDMKSKVLVCAPSNAAIDEISARLATKGIYNSQMENTKCKFLRFGLYDRKDKEKKYLETLNGKILEKYSLEYLSDQKYKKDLDSLSEKIENLRRQLNNYNKDKDKNIGYIKNTESEISICLKLFSDKKYQKSIFEHDILISSPILCTTLNNAGNERLKKANLSYEYLIIDEASQCVEPSCLIPLCHEVKKLILVGDHMQLPATVFYPKATKILYNRSLFERLIDNKYPRYILTVQYRMQPNISKFISEVFYDNKLTNDESHIININKEPLYSLIKNENNFSFFDISYGEEIFEEGKKSYYNESEIRFCLKLVKKIITIIKDQIFDYENILKEKNIEHNNCIDKINNKINENENENKNENNIHDNNNTIDPEEKIKILQNYKFAIICTYKSQVIKFKDFLKTDKFFKNQKINDIEINTVDSFQGQERDIIIFSTVRANFKDEAILEDGEIPSSPEKSNNNKESIGIGFLNDFRRMNVGLSRAKIGCFVVGNFETLKNNSYWGKLLNYCKDRKSFFSVEKSNELEAIKNILK